MQKLTDGGLLLFVGGNFHNFYILHIIVLFFSSSIYIHPIRSGKSILKEKEQNLRAVVCRKNRHLPTDSGFLVVKPYYLTPRTNKVKSVIENK